MVLPSSVDFGPVVLERKKSEIAYTDGNDCFIFGICFCEMFKYTRRHGEKYNILSSFRGGGGLLFEVFWKRPDIT